MYVNIDSVGSSPLIGIVLIALMAIIPMAILAMTSFVKISVVLNILRSAIGAQQVPSATLLSLISLVLTMYVMSPVATEVLTRANEKIESSKLVSKTEKETKVDIGALVELTKYSLVPLRDFLSKHSNEREKEFFSKNLVEMKQGTALAASKESGENFFSLVPAFVLSELSEAFFVGFVIYLPFLVIDLLVSNILIGLGMMMLSPLTITLPLKIIVFVLCDGWFLLARGLILGYA